VKAVMNFSVSSTRGRGIFGLAAKLLALQCGLCSTETLSTLVFWERGEVESKHERKKNPVIVAIFITQN